MNSENITAPLTKTRFGQGAAWSKQRRWLTLVGLLLLVSALNMAGHIAFLDSPPNPVGDEQIYLQNARTYAQILSGGRWNRMLSYRGRYEHPPLMRMLWSMGFVAADKLKLPAADYLIARSISVLQGLALVILMTLVNPWAGLYLAGHSVETLFTTRAYFEALPSLTSSLAVLSYVRFRKVHRARWFYLTAFALGVTAASKYIYLVAGIALAPFLFWDNRHRIHALLAFGAVALVTFVLLDPALWTSPIERLAESIQYHLGYQNGAAVQDSGRQWWYPLAYLVVGQGQMEPEWGLSFNLVIFVLGWLGLPRLYRINRIYFVWFVCALLFLVAWPTKWNQYSMIFIPPMCLSAGFFTTAGVDWIKVRLREVRAGTNQTV